MAEDTNKYGKVLEEVTVLEDSNHPVRISLVEQHDQVWLDIRKMYRLADGQLGYGKGLRVEVDEGSADIMVLAAQALLVEYSNLDG